MSFGEIIFIIAIAVLLFGPDKIPEIARGLGQGVRAMKNATDNIKREIMSQVDDDTFKEIEEEIEKAKNTMDSTANETKKNITQILDDDNFEGPIKRS